MLKSHALDEDMAERIYRRLHSICISENCNLLEQRHGDLQFALGKLKEISNRANPIKRRAA